MKTIKLRPSRMRGIPTSVVTRKVQDLETITVALPDDLGFEPSHQDLLVWHEEGQVEVPRVCQMTPGERARLNAEARAENAKLSALISRRLGK